jgi:hypothetical protein
MSMVSAVAAVALLAVACQSFPEHVQMHSFFPPILEDYWENGLRYWSFGSNAVVTDDYVRITGPSPNSRGYFWNRHPNHLRSFDVNLTVRLLKRQQGWFADTSDGGLALWYTAATPRHVPSNFYGSNPAFEGLGVVLDHSNQLTVLVNDGEAVTDMANSKLGSCRVVGLANHDLTLMVQYDDEASTLDLSYGLTVRAAQGAPHTHSSFTAQHCTQIGKVQLPTQNYFGVTATNTKSAQANHELVSFFVRPLRGGHEGVDEEVGTGLHLFDLAQEKQLQKEWEGRGDVMIIPDHTKKDQDPVPPNGGGVAAKDSDNMIDGLEDVVAPVQKEANSKKLKAKDEPENPAEEGDNDEDDQAKP